MPGFRRELISILVCYRQWVLIEESPDGTSRLARYVIEGTYGEDGGVPTISLTLLDRQMGVYLEGSTIRLNPGAWASGLQKFIRRTAIAFNIHVSTPSRLGASGADEMDRDVFEVWLEADNLLRTWRKTNSDHAEGLLRQVIKRAPSFAPAYSTASTIENTRHLSDPGIWRDPALLANARDLALQAVAIDPLDARNHHALAWSSAMHDAFNQAELHFEMAIDLNPGNPMILIPSAHGLSYCGLRPRAERLIELALELNPEIIPRHWGYAMCVRYFAGRYPEAGERAGSAILDLPAWKACAQ